MQSLVQQFITDFYHSSALEVIAVAFGIASVVYSRRENILVYPVGIVSTAIFIYIYLKSKLYADAAVNLYYTILSVTGWMMWARKTGGETALRVTASSARDWRRTLLFFGLTWAGLYLVLRYATDSTVPLADSFTSAAAFTGMWLMNRKKLESWTWWIVTNLASMPLNFYKHLVFASFEYLVLLVLAVLGYITWSKKIRYATR